MKSSSVRLLIACIVTFVAGTVFALGVNAQTSHDIEIPFRDLAPGQETFVRVDPAPFPVESIEYGYELDGAYYTVVTSSLDWPSPNLGVMTAIRLHHIHEDGNGYEESIASRYLGANDALPFTIEAMRPTLLASEAHEALEPEPGGNGSAWRFGPEGDPNDDGLLLRVQNRFYTFWHDSPGHVWWNGISWAKGKWIIRCHPQNEAAMRVEAEQSPVTAHTWLVNRVGKPDLDPFQDAVFGEWNCRTYTMGQDGVTSLALYTGWLSCWRYVNLDVHGCKNYVCDPGEADYECKVVVTYSGFSPTSIGVECGGTANLKWCTGPPGSVEICVWVD